MPGDRYVDLGANLRLLRQLVQHRGDVLALAAKQRVLLVQHRLFVLRPLVRLDLVLEQTVAVVHLKVKSIASHVHCGTITWDPPTYRR